MAWSNAAERTTFQVEKSHSLSFAVRVEDRLHENIIQVGDECWFTVRPENYTMDVDDSDITNGTTVVPGNGITAVGNQIGDGATKAFQFLIDAAKLNLDPELDYWYDITYVRDGYSLSVSSGRFLVLDNVTNRGAQTTAVTDGNVFQLVASVQNRNVLNVSAAMPMPETGPPGAGSYVIAKALNETVGQTVTHPLSDISAPNGRAIQVGDVIFSSITKGVLGTVQSITLTGTPSATIITRQVYGLQTLKALLDITMHVVAPGGGPSIEDIDATWTIQKTAVPLPAGYEYRVGDLVFSHSAVSGYAINKKLLISIVEGTTPTQLNVRTKVVFPIFLDSMDIQGMLSDMVQTSTTVNSKPLSSNIVLSEDDITDGTANKKFTSAQNTKLNALPTNASLTTALVGKAASAHAHEQADINGLTGALASKLTGTGVSVIWAGTQAEYDNISPKNPNTLYFIKA